MCHIASEEGASPHEPTRTWGVKSRARGSLRASCVICKIFMDGYVGEEIALSFHLLLKRTLNPTNVQLSQRGLRLTALVSRLFFLFSLCFGAILHWPLTLP